MLSAYRRFYLYSALSISVIAAAVAAAALLALLFRSAGLGREPLDAQDLRLSLSQAAALLVFAIPIGYVHLRLIRSGLGDPAEGVAGVRHFYLNLWVLVSLVALVLAGIQVLMIQFIPFRQKADLSIPLASMIAAGGVALLGWQWRTATPAPPVWEKRAAVGTLGFTAAVAAFGVGVAAVAADQLVSGPYPGRGFATTPAAQFEGEVRWGVSAAALGLAVWGIAAGWLWPHRTARLRLAYLALAYAIGIALLTLGASLQIEGIDAAVRGRSMPHIGAAWSPLLMGVLLAGLHGGWLFLDRGRNGHPAVTLERVLIGLPALAGLTALVVALVLLWTTAVDFWILPGHYSGDARSRVSTALGPLVVGLAIYPVLWWLFLRRSDPSSAVRRFAVFTVICLSLVATVVAGAVAVFNLFSLLAGAQRWMDHQYDLALWGVPALIFAALFALYLSMYLRDQRRQRALAPAPAAVAPVDPLEALFEEVAEGRLRPHDAAARARLLAH